MSRRSREDFAGKVIDVHSHVGVSLKAYARIEYPYAQTVEGLYYRQLSGGVDVNVVFPLSADLHFDSSGLGRGEMVPAAEPLSATPYAVENLSLCREIFDYCPEISGRFLPFVSIDPARAVAGQVAELRRLGRDYPVYGIKVNPVGCQSPAAELLGAGGALLDLAEECGLPLLFHVTTLPGEEYSQAADVFRIVESRPDLRFCLAHCLVFSREFLERADAAPNVWVDTAAMKIQVELIRREVARGAVPASGLVDADYSDHKAVMRVLCESFPDTMIWGTDSPAYSYVCRRKQGIECDSARSSAGGAQKREQVPTCAAPSPGRSRRKEGEWIEFGLKATYEDEVAALDALPPHSREKASGLNTLDFLFGAD